VNLTLPREAEALIQRLIATGKFSNAPEVVQAGLEKLSKEGETVGAPLRPHGFFSQDYTDDSERIALETAVTQMNLRPEREPSPVGNLEMSPARI
jgi:Arc/MetJ-type ribon-helix-helix transcriptional regulator